MEPRDLGLLLALGAMWGSSLLFIKVAGAVLLEERITAHALLGLILLGVAGVSGIARRKPSVGTP